MVLAILVRADREGGEAKGKGRREKNRSRRAANRGEGKRKEWRRAGEAESGKGRLGGRVEGFAGGEQCTNRMGLGLEE